MSDVIASVNGTVWVFSAMLIGLVCVQAIMFLRYALSFNKKHALVSDSEIKQAASAGAVSVIGPAMSVIVVALSLIQLVGPALTFMRCGVIGAPSWELMMANTSAEAVGVAFNTPEFTANVFVLCMFGMTWASAPYFVNTILTLKPLDIAVKNSVMGGAASAKDKGAQKKESFVPRLGNAAIMGIMGNSLYGYLQNPAQLSALITGFLVAFVVQSVSRKNANLKWLGVWNMPIALVFGATAGYIVSTMA